MIIHLCDLPEGCLAASGQLSFCLVLLQMGFTKPHESLHTLVRSYRTVSPLPDLLAQPSAVCSLLHVRQVTPTWLSPALCPVKPRLSSMHCYTAIIRVTHRHCECTGKELVDEAVEAWRVHENSGT